MRHDVSFVLADALADRAWPLGSWDGAGSLPALEPEAVLVAGRLEAIARAYLFAELESAALIVCADAVTDARASLRASRALASKIEGYTELQRTSPTTLEREAFFVRCFGLGRHASLDERGNHAFFPRLSELCGALGGLSLRGQSFVPRGYLEARARAALERLLAELSLLAGGDLLVVPRIGRLSSAAVAILADAELASLLGVVGLHAVVNALVSGVAVDLAVAVGRGRAGQALLEDCGRLWPVLRAGNPIAPEHPAIVNAVQWLASYGSGPAGQGA